MKYGAHSYLFTDRWTDAQLHILDLCRGLGLQMVELSLGDDVRFDLRKTGDHARSLGLDLFIGPGGAWPLECDLSDDDPSNRRRGLDWHRRIVDQAAELGAVCYAGALYGHPGVARRRRPPVDEYPRTAEGLHSLADYAAQHNIVIALEPMSHFRTHLVNTPEQLIRLMDLADHQNLHALLDTYHIVTEVRDYRTAIRTLGPRLFGIHACENDRGAPGGGIVPWRAVFEALVEVGYGGYIALETYNSTIGDFAFERGMFHNVCPDGEEFVRRGIGFLTEMEDLVKDSSRRTSGDPPSRPDVARDSSA